MPDVGTALDRLGRDNDAFEMRREVGGVKAALLRERVESLELGEADGGGDVGEAVVEAELGTAVTLALAVGAQTAQSSCEGSVVGGDHAAFTGCHVLRGVEAE